MAALPNESLFSFVIVIMAPVIAYYCSNANRWLFHGAEGWLCVAFEEKKDEVAGRKRGRRNKRAIMNDQPGGVLSDRTKCT